jgi:predicted O-linked N-acetylglucosamine transferase (SPINDLY family)
MTTKIIDLQQQTRELLASNKYSQISSLYEDAIAIEPEVISHYWHLGLAYLLQGYEEEAQTTWMLALAEVDSEEAEQLAEELIKILDTEAKRQASIEQFKTSWLIRNHIREIAPTFVNNLLHLIQIAIDLDELTPGNLNDWQVATTLEQTASEKIDLFLLFDVLKKLIEFPVPETLAFAEACRPFYIEESGVFIDNLMVVAVRIANQSHRPDFAASLAEICLKSNANHSETLRHLSIFYCNSAQYQKSRETAQKFFDNCNDKMCQIQGSYLILRSILSAGAWLETIDTLTQRHSALVTELVTNPPETLSLGIAKYLFPANYFLPYLADNPQETRRLQNKIGALSQKNIQAAYADFVALPYNTQQQENRKLKIGYVAHTLREHSVGWLSRWIFKHYNREEFHTTLYLIYQEPHDHEWFKKQVDCVHNFRGDGQKIAEQIKIDGIDILVDLDSITLDTTCEVMTLKPAPIQVTWLGMDASGIPAVDYYIADNYVLPENAQEYYSEKIWRLPNSYVSVDGFEVGVPTLRRTELGIPDDAVIYFSAQQGFKRHPDTVRLQMQIIKQVPNSYFLIKGKSDNKAMEEFFTQIAESERVEAERLKFLARDESELVHRANIGIADVVLDTYPYNGATTTLETLWIGVPIVTRVGEQFAARNTYTFMKNVGVTEGIAWTDAEYIEWGVRLGKEPVLRQQIAWKLRQSRQTSPLWDAKQFTREIEKAYKQMWQNYVDNLNKSIAPINFGQYREKNNGIF